MGMVTRIGRWLGLSLTNLSSPLLMQSTTRTLAHLSRPVHYQPEQYS